MPTATDILRIAAGEVGYSRWDDPEAGTKYGRDYATRHGAYFGTSGVPFCDMFCTWVLRRGGATDFDSAYVPGRIAAARSKGWTVAVTSAQPGDMVCFDWDGDGVADHIGFVELNLGAAGLQTIEGNTNNGAVARRTRSWGTVCAMIRYPYSGASTADTGDYNYRGDSPTYIRTVQTLLRDVGYSPGAVDGILGPLTFQAVKDFQAAHGLEVDGMPGPKTMAALRDAKVKGLWLGKPKSQSTGSGVAQGAYNFRQDSTTYVRTIQSLLKAAGYSLEVDGILGPITYQAVKSFQAANGLEVDGLPGPKTLTKLREVVIRKRLK